LLAAFAARENARTVFEPKRLAIFPTVRAYESVLPASLFEIGGARGVIREKPLELRERRRKCQIAALLDAGDFPIT
jgi:hypothetical protein